MAEEKSRDGSARNTRSQTARYNNKDMQNSSNDWPTTGRLQEKSTTPSCALTVSDGLTSLKSTGRCDDGNDDSIASFELAEAAELKSFNFSRTWTVPRTTLHLSTGPMALRNISFLVSDAHLACESILIGLPVLRHLHIDSRTLLERNREALDGTNCAEVGNPTTEQLGAIGRLMLAMLQGVKGRQYVEGQEYSQSTAFPSKEKPRVDYYETRNAQDPCPDLSLLDPLDDEQDAEVKAEIERMLTRANENGLPPVLQPKLRQLALAHTNEFRISFSHGPPAKLPPLHIHLTADASPVKVKLRNYSETQRDFLKNMTSTLIHAGMAYENPTAEWASAPLLVPKTGTSKFRFTVDLRLVNSFTKQHHFPMPRLETELTKLAGSKCFANFDLSHGYWQLELAEDSRDCQSFITPDGVFTPTRVLHGTTNAVAHLQSSLSQEVPEELRTAWLHWLDDILLHNQSADRLLANIEALFKMCNKLNLKLHPGKCTLYATSLRWCGPVLVRTTVDAHLNTALAELISPLQDFLEKVYTKAGKRTKRAVARVRLSSLGWSKLEQEAFTACKQALQQQVMLSHRDTSQRLCIFTDACDSIWSGIATQIPNEDTTNPYEEQRHSPLAFLSGRFTWTQLRWSVLEKEAYAVLATVQRLHWLAATPQGFERKQRLGRHHRSRVATSNASQTRKDTCPVVSNGRRLLVANYGIHRNIKSKYKRNRPSAAKKTDNLWRIGTRIWVPTEAEELQLRLCIIAHTGPAGHRGRDVTEKALSERFYWPTVKTDNYIDLGMGRSGDKYVLIVRDDHSHYCWLFPFADTKAEIAAHALVDWCAAFGVPKGLMSDGPTHFKNETLRLVTKTLRTPHHFTLPYCPWSNGAVERLGRELLRVARALLSELQMRSDAWPDILPIIQSALNNTPSKHRANTSPITAF
eukprot:IDg3723t1